MWDSCMSWLGHNGLWRDLAGALVFWSNNTWPLSALGKQMISLVYYSVFPPFFYVSFSSFSFVLLFPIRPRHRGPGTEQAFLGPNQYFTISISIEASWNTAYIWPRCGNLVVPQSCCSTIIDIKGLLPPDPSGPRGENQQHGTVGPWS